MWAVGGWPRKNGIPDAERFMQGEGDDGLSVDLLKEK
jgi:hypothetical protein